MSYKSMEGKMEWDAGKNNLLDRLAVQLGGWAKEGKLPDVVDQGVAGSLEMQRARLKQKGLAMELDLVPNMNPPQYNRTWKDSKYTNVLKFHMCRRNQSYYRNGKRVYRSRRNSTLYTTITTANYETAVENDTYCCPSCGAISKIKELREGCPYCRTQFLMSDLFPKITNFFFLENFSLDERVVKRWVWFCALAGALAGGAMGIRDGYSMALLILGHMLLEAVVFAFMGYLGFSFVLLVYVLVKAGGSLPQLLSCHATQGKLTRYMKPYDALFSYPYFEGQVLSLMKMILYADDITKLSAYEGAPLEAGFSDIIDTVYAGSMGLRGFRVEGAYCHVDMDVYVVNTYCRGTRIFSRRDIFRVCLCKNIRHVTSLGFSIKKAQCMGCGGSFDAVKQRICPFCGLPYSLKEEDWVITTISKK